MKIAAALSLALVAVANQAFACTVAPHSATRLPETFRTFEGQGALSAAWFDDPTQDYAHGVLGDAIEPRRLMAYSQSSISLCGEVGVVLDGDHVFEDTFSLRWAYSSK